MVREDRRFRSAVGVSVGLVHAAKAVFVRPIIEGPGVMLPVFTPVARTAMSRTDLQRFAYCDPSRKRLRSLHRQRQVRHRTCR